MSGINKKKIWLSSGKSIRLIKFNQDFISDFLTTINVAYLPNWANQIETVTFSIHSDSGSNSAMSVMTNGYDIIDITYEHPYILIRNKLLYSIMIQAYLDNSIFDGTII